MLERIRRNLSRPYVGPTLIVLSAISIIVGLALSLVPENHPHYELAARISNLAYEFGRNFILVGVVITVFGHGYRQDNNQNHKNDPEQS